MGGRRRKKKKRQNRTTGSLEQDEGATRLETEKQLEREQEQKEIENLFQSIEPKKSSEDASSQSERNGKLNVAASIPKQIQKVRLEANFYPKFENEAQQDDDIREQMKQRVASGQGHVEASLKHSGSLVLWSGGQRYYSKNATDNVYTYVGEILLRQHFCRAWWPKKKEDPPPGDPNNNGKANKKTWKLEEHVQKEAKYEECSQFITRHRLTCAFEVVTAVLGDHGARPARDFLILTAVADRANERFYTTTEIVQFAQRYRLPHNDTWIFSSPSRVQDLFELYDGKRETGLATDVVEGLNAAANAAICSMYPHAVFQGDILEGLVIRYVPSARRGDNEGRRSRRGRGNIVHRLALSSQSLRSEIPAELPDCHQLLQQELASDNLDSDDGKASSSSSALLLRTSVRTCFRDSQNAAAKNGRGGGSASTSSFEKALRAILKTADGGHRRSVQRLSSSSKSAAAATVDIPSLAESLLKTKPSDDDDDDMETRRLATVIQSLTKLNKRVNYSVMKETYSDDDDDSEGPRWLVIIHVLHDVTFKKYKAFADASDMSLYRGFVVELGESPLGKTEISEPANGQETSKETSIVVEGQDDVLMLKMKFLPYMVRTFGCRNGLGNLRNQGENGFVSYTNNLLSKWGVSDAARKTWKPFFRAWAHYAKTRLHSQLPNERDLAQLSSFSYLEHLERFRKMYDESGGEMPTSGNDLETTSEEAEARVNEVGLIVFVPGIVGCGKSSLLGTATQAELSGKLDRKVILREGDRTRGSFWQTVKKERRKNPQSVFIADKNVPGTKSWGIVADICASTRALGVPLVPDELALKTTKVLGMRKPNGDFVSDRVHIYPFSLRFLAVCMARVLGRPPGTHPGKLDSATTRAAFVVLKFFGLYRKIPADEFLDMMHQKFESRGARLAQSPVKVPFFKEKARPLPGDLVELLTEALQAQLYFDLANMDIQMVEDEYVAGLDSRLRACVAKHRKLLLGMAIDKKTSQEAVVSQILARVGDLDSTDSSPDELASIKLPGSNRYITLASVDVSVDDVHDLLRCLLEKDGVESFAESALGEGSPNEILRGSRCPDNRFVSNTHVTLAHCQSVSQSTMRQAYGEMVGCLVSVQPTGFLWNDHVAALEVTLEGRTGLKSLNEFVHVTLWVDDGSSAVKANELPKQLAQGNARYLEISGAASLSGKVSLRG